MPDIDEGYWLLLQAIIRQAFEQAEDPKTSLKKLKEINAWAERVPNLFLHCYSEIGGYDYGRIVKSLIAKCDSSIIEFG